MNTKNFPLIMATTLILFGCSGTKPGHLGVKDGMLSACPGSPNCVSTQAVDAKHRIEPLQYQGSKDDAVKKLTGVISSMKRSRIVTSSDSYIHTEFTSALFRFVDDVEFFFDDKEKIIHFRSASRLGYSDLGVNRKRMEEIRRRFTTP
ncbi:DUF1499 domain-containing protein [bacterium]|nr:DUF1499 domain-containing protein [bacterium]